MLTKRDVVISLIISTGSFVIALGIIGVKNLYMATIFFTGTLIVTLILFFIFKPKSANEFSDKRWDY